jgi:hypothetical protein
MSTASLGHLRLRALQEPTSQALVKYLAQMHQQDTMSTAPLRPLRLLALQELTILTQDQPVQLHVLLHLQDTMLIAQDLRLKQLAQQEPTSQALARLHALMHLLEIM